MTGLSRAAKLTGAVLAVAVLGAAAAAVALKVLLPEPKVRSLVTDGARRQLGREVRLRKVGVGLRGLRLEGLEVSEAPDFSAGTFASLERFHLRPSWRALLRRRLVVSSVSVEGLKAAVVRRSDGSFNFSSLASSAPAASHASPAPAAGAARPEFNVRRLSVRRGTLSYRDAAGAAWELSDVELDATDLGLAEPFGLDLSLRARGGTRERPLEARAAFRGKVSPARGEREKAALELRSLELESGGLLLDAKGRVANLAEPDVELGFALRAAGKELLAGTVKARVAASGAGSGALKAETGGLDTSVLAALSASVPKVAVPAATLDLKASWAGDEARIESLSLKVPQGTAAASGRVTGLFSGRPRPDLSVRLALSLPATGASDLPVRLGALPAGFVVPALKVAGTARARGDDLALDGVTVSGAGGAVRLSGTVAGALAGRPRPALTAAGELALPALTGADLPFPGLPAGLRLPPTRWEGELEYSPERLKLRRLRLQAGGTDVSLEGAVQDPAGAAAYDLLVKCRSFVLQELTALTPATREMGLSGSGFFALSVTGSKAKPEFAGKLRFQDVGAAVAGLPLREFAGTASFDPKRVDLPNLKGRLGDGRLDLDLTVKDWAGSPEVQVDAKLDRFDLGAWLDAKKRYQAEAKAAAKPAPGGSAAPAQAAKPIRTRGRLEIGALAHPNAAIEKVAASWDVFGLTPDLKRLSGEAKVSAGGGRLRAVGDMATQSPVVKVVVFPLLVVQKLGRLGGLRLFPDFNDIALRGFLGDYVFVGSSRVDLQACKLEYSIVSPK